MCIPSLFTLHAPILSEYERHSLVETCLNQPQLLYIAGRYLAHDDFRNLLQPANLINDVVDILLTLMLTPYEDVTHFTVGSTHDFVQTMVTSGGTTRQYRRLHHENQLMNNARTQLFQPRRIVFTFLGSSHYTTFIVNNREKCINYLASIHY